MKMRINRFQQYSQKENTVTNNVLLMLSGLNDLNPMYYKLMVERVNEDAESQEYSAAPIFQQQIRAGKGIIDGHIEIKASKILIETKLNHTELVNKLLKYGDAFKPGSQNQLWHLSSKKFTDQEVIEIVKKLKDKFPFKIAFVNLLFSDLVENLEGLLQENPHDKELGLLTEDFREYCSNERLVSDEKSKLLFVPTGFSYDWNMKHKMYFCPIHWHRQPFTYFGLYNWKAVRSIATVENVLEADYDAKTKNLKVTKGDATVDQIERLQKGLDEWGESQSGLKYYLFKLSDFHETEFRKASPGGIQGYRYKDLNQFVPKSIGNTAEIAEKLKNIFWE
jgi:hypothetical protein